MAVRGGRGFVPSDEGTSDGVEGHGGGGMRVVEAAFVREILTCNLGR